MRPTQHLTDSTKGSVPIQLLDSASLEKWLPKADERTARWVQLNGFSGKPGQFCLLPDAGGALECVLVGAEKDAGIWDTAALAESLPSGRYHLDPEPKEAVATRVALAWALASYTFENYSKSEQSFAELVWPKKADRKYVERAAEGTYLIRDLINTPAEDLGPPELADAAKTLARAHKAKCTVITGEQLLKKNYPMIHTVGRAADKEPCLIDLRWEGSARGKQITLVGKGVIFDSGGLDIKNAAGMRFMKKDMGGSAHVLGLAAMIMAAKLKVRLRVLVPAVENAISGNAFRPGDVLRSRQGLTVEIGNTDAEGRLVLADALTEASSEDPALIVDFATLTGAARIALGTEVPAFYTHSDKLATRLMHFSKKDQDPVWRMPLHQPYRELLNHGVADLNHTADGGFGGSITAALFLNEFVGKDIPWIHVDLMAWNLRGRPGRPIGGEAMGLRAMYRLIEEFA